MRRGNIQKENNRNRNKRTKDCKRSPGTEQNNKKWVYIPFEAKSRTIQQLSEHANQYEETANYFL